MAFTMTPIEDRIAQLEWKPKQEQAKKAQIEAKKRALANQKSHADDTRRKILVGAIILNKVATGDWPENKFIQMVDTHLTRDGDRALFVLLPLPQDPPTTTD